MRKVVMSVYECEPGMQMAETIFNEYGAIIVSENTILDNHIIRKLHNLGIIKVKIVSQSDDEIISNDSEIFKAQYNENVEAVKEILYEISTGKSINIEVANIVSDSIMDRMNENRDIVRCINQIRGVDDYTYTHCINVSLVSMLLAKWLKYDESSIKLIVQAGLLHDVGKGKIDPYLLNKPSKLSKEEYEEIKKHPVFGYRMLEGININKNISKAVLMHHEREDGSGYPMGMKSPQIHEYAKIIAVADIYDAMTSNRVYKEKDSPFDVFELMENETFGILQPKVVNAFLSNIASYYIGDMVRLNTEEIGEIVYINQRHVSQPVVRVGNSFIDLTVNRDVKIIELL